MMRFQAIESLRDLDAHEFDRLDPSCGPVGSYARLVQLERDRRWLTEYLCAWESSTLLAAVPLYRLNKGAWPDPSYDPAMWGRDGVGSPTEITVVGGRSGLLSNLHIASAISGTRRHLRLIEEVLTRETRTSLLLPFLADQEFRQWEEVTAPRLEHQVLGTDARFDRQLAGETLPKKARQTLQRDRRMVENYGVESAIRTWSEVRPFAAGLIARNSHANGLPDAEQLVDFRVRQWEACPGVEVVVLTAEARGERGVVVCVLWRDWMDLQEIGITGSRGDLRRTLYAQLLFHLPVQFARQRGGVRHLRAGLKAERAKAIRGASFILVGGGVVNLSTRPSSARHNSSPHADGS